MRLCWADKIPLALFALVTVVMLWLGMGANPDNSNYCELLRAENPTWTSADSNCFVTAEQHWSAFAWIEGFLFLKFILPIWAAARLIDLFAGGIAIRRRNRDMRTNAAQATADIDLSSAEWTRVEPDWLQRLRRRG
jgi:hypothetical protein